MKYSNRLLAAALTLCLTLSLLPLSALAANKRLPFDDVNEEAWYYDAIQYAYDSDIMTGTSKKVFSPEANLTRAQVCQILYNMEDTPRVSGSAFEDVRSSDWHYKAVNWAADKGIVNGVTEDQFAPDQNITREQLVTILYRYAQYKKYDAESSVSLQTFTDAANVSEYAVPAMGWAIGEGFITGMTETTIVPQGTATRAQAATILMRFCQGIEAELAFLAKDVNDFRDHEVINFDSSKETNFAVVHEDAVAAEAKGTANQLVSADEENGVYTLSNIDKTVSALVPGDILYIDYGSGKPFLLLKVGEIKITQDTAEIQAADAELSELFEYIDLDMEVAVTEDHFQPMTAVNDNLTVSFADHLLDDTPVPLAEAPLLAASNVKTSVGTTLKLDYTHQAVQMTAEINLTFTIKIRYDSQIWNMEEIELSVKQTDKLTVKVSRPFTSEEGDLFREACPPVLIPLGLPGLNAKFETYAFFDLDAAASGSFTCTYESENGTLYKNKKAYPINQSGFDSVLGVKGSFTLSFGLGLSGGVELNAIAVKADLGMEAEAGFQADAAASLYPHAIDKETNHLCGLCVSGDVGLYASLSFKSSYTIGAKKKTLVSLELAKVEVPFADFYISVKGENDPFEFGWGKCPYVEHLVTVSLVDQHGAPVTGTKVQISADNGSITAFGEVNETGIYTAYCLNGSYTAVGFGPEGYDASVSAPFSVGGKPVKVELRLNKEEPPPEPDARTFNCEIYNGFENFEEEGSPVGTAQVQILSPKKAIFTFNLSPEQLMAANDTGYPPSGMYDVEITAYTSTPEQPDFSYYIRWEHNYKEVLYMGFTAAPDYDYRYSIKGEDHPETMVIEVTVYDSSDFTFSMEKDYNLRAYAVQWVSST